MNPILYQYQIIADQFIKGYWLADSPQGIPNKPRTRFHLGFMTKQFTVRGRTGSRYGGVSYIQHWLVDKP